MKRSKKKVSAKRKAKMASSYLDSEGKRDPSKKSKYSVKRFRAKQGKFSSNSPFFQG
tara:strand:- start:584 stop:754 length:171 start_codon:yes stop_codon:yes gene_type:complete